MSRSIDDEANLARRCKARGGVQEAFSCGTCKYENRGCLVREHAERLGFLHLSNPGPRFSTKITDKDMKEFNPEHPKVEPADYLMWIGRSYYSIKSFIEEARSLGLCKRVPGLPVGLVVGKSRVFLAHDYSGSEGAEGGGRVFGWFTVRGVEHILKEPMSVDDLEKRGVRVLDIGTALGRPDRGCGQLAAGGFYLVSHKDMDKLRDDIKSGVWKGDTINLLDPAISIGVKRFRGYKQVDGALILSGGSESEWYGGSVSRRAEQNRANIAKWRAIKRRKESEAEKESKV